MTELQTKGVLHWHNIDDNTDTTSDNFTYTLELPQSFRGRLVRWKLKQLEHLTTDETGTLTIVHVGLNIPEIMQAPLGLTTYAADGQLDPTVRAKGVEDPTIQGIITTTNGTLFIDPNGIPSFFAFWHETPNLSLGTVRHITSQLTIEIRRYNIRMIPQTGVKFGHSALTLEWEMMG